MPVLLTPALAATALTSREISTSEQNALRLLAPHASGPGVMPSLPKPRASAHASGPGVMPSLPKPRASAHASGPGAAPARASAHASGPGAAPARASAHASGPGAAPARASAHGVSRQELLRVAAALAGASADYDPERPGYCSAYPRGRAFRYEVAAALTMLAADPACVDVLRPQTRARATAGDTSAPQRPSAGTDGLAALLASCSKVLLN